VTIRDGKGARAAKAKGRAAENAVVDYLRDTHGIQAERRRLAGSSDLGDIAGWPGVVVEVKSEKRITLAGYMDELAAEVDAATSEFGWHQIGLCVVKKRGTSDVSQWYAVLPFGEAVKLIRRGSTT